MVPDESLGSRIDGNPDDGYDLLEGLLSGQVPVSDSDRAELCRMTPDWPHKVGDTDSADDNGPTPSEMIHGCDPRVKCTWKDWDLVRRAMTGWMDGSL